MQGERFDRLCSAKGADDEISRAQLIGTDRRTLYRWRRGISIPTLPNAYYVAHLLGTTVEDLWKDAS